jgi:outer membrane protein, multidrug efflux system
MLIHQGINHMNKNRFLLLGLIATLLGGCTLAPKYSRPAAPIPAEWPSGTAYEDSLAMPGALAAAEIHWREFFADPRLQKIIETALSNNLDLRLAVLNVERARAVYGIRRVELLPTANAAADWYKARIPVDISGSEVSPTIEQFDVNLGITSWEIDFFGRIRSLKDKALEEYLATEEARRSVQILLISEVAGAYLVLASDRERLKLAEFTLASQEAAYYLIRRRHEVGLAGELDLRQAQTRVDAARVDTARFTRLSAQGENALNLLVGSPVSSELLPDDLSGVRPHPEISPGISSKVLLRRPDILQAENLLKAANANIGAARAAFFPRISLTAVFGTASGDLSRLFRPGQDAWTFTPQIVMPIFDARTWWALKATKVDGEIAVAQYQKSIQTAFKEVADALATLGTVDDQLAAQQSLVIASSESYRLSTARYDKGIDNYLGVLVAQRSLYEAQQGLITIHLARLANQVRLYAVLGGGSD